MTLITIPTVPLDAVVVEKSEADALITRINAAVIETQADADGLAVIVTEASRRAKAAEEKRVELTKPLNDHVKLINGEFAFIDALKLVAKAGKQRIDRWLREQEEARLEAERVARVKAKEEEDRQRKELEKKAVKADAKGNAAAADELRAQSETVYVPPTPPALPVAAKPKGVPMREIWKARVVNAALVPREFCCPDEKKIGDTARATKGTLSIPGVEIWREVA